MSTPSNDLLSIVNDWVVWTTTSLPIYKQSSSTVLDANVVPYLFLTLLFTTVVFIVESYLDRRQLSRFSGPKCVLPKELVDFVTSETFDKSVAYGKDKFAFKIFEGTYSFAEGIFMVCIGFLPYIWDHSEVAASYLLKLSSYTESPSELFKEIVVTW
eukprot:gene66449-90968_t